MNKGGSPHGVYGESTRSLRKVHKEFPRSPLYFGESLWTPCGHYVDCRKYSHGLPLKSMESSWSPWKPVGECKVLRFFNICYECNDARDDYSKLWQQQNATDGVFPHWFRADDNDNFDGDNYNDSGDIMVHEEYEADQYTSVGKKGQQRLEQMAEIQKIVTSAGWLDQCPDGPPSMDFTQ